MKIYIRPNERMYDYFIRKTFALLDIHLYYLLHLSLGSNTL